MTYDCGGLFFVTVCCHEKVNYLDSPQARDIIVNSIKSVSKGNPGWVYCYAVMPNHFHCLILLDKGISLIDVLRLVKGRTTPDLRALGLRNVWQRSFHDHRVVEVEDRDETAKYILENPVRKGLVSKWQDWPWCGILDWMG